MASDFRQDAPGEHVILLAVNVLAPTRKAAEEILHARWSHDRDGGPVECWWVAEDERYDHSDNDSAIFVPKGSQDEARALLRAHGLVG